jgi:hypothetical protein
MQLFSQILLRTNIYPCNQILWHFMHTSYCSIPGQFGRSTTGLPAALNFLRNIRQNQPADSGAHFFSPRTETGPPRDGNIPFVSITTGKRVGPRKRAYVRRTRWKRSALVDPAEKESGGRRKRSETWKSLQTRAGESCGDRNGSSANGSYERAAAVNRWINQKQSVHNNRRITAANRYVSGTRAYSRVLGTKRYSDVALIYLNLRARTAHRSRSLPRFRVTRLLRWEWEREKKRTKIPPTLSRHRL